MLKNPDRANVDKNDRQLYDKIVEGKDGFFKGLGRKEQFLSAMAFGFSNNVRQSLSKKDGFFNTREINSKDMALINAVFLYENDNLEDLTDGEKVLRVAEEYAHAGIRILSDQIDSTSFGDFWKIYEKNLHDIYEKCSSDEK